MNGDLSDYRKTYSKGELLEGVITDNPFELFKIWFTEVEAEGGIEEINAMTVSTLGKDGFPKSRITLLKHYDENGFVFYTNYNSEKGQAISNHPQVCLSFFWPNLERQVIIKGIAVKESEEKSKAYFDSRPKGSQLGAWASDQSAIISSREVLSRKMEDLKKEYANKQVPKPKHWGGFVVEPHSIEFWQGRPNRLHDRFVYQKGENDHWSYYRLAP